MAVIEGHAEHVMDAVAPDLLPVAAAAARGARPPAHVPVGLVAAAGEAARTRAQAAPVRAGQVLLRRDRRARPASTALHHVFSAPGGAADAGRAPATRRLAAPGGLPAAAALSARARRAATRRARPRARATPRSSNRSPEPTTSSLTVLDASTSPGSASCITREAMWTAIPARHRRVARTRRCAPRRGRSGRARATPSTISPAQLTARAGPVERRQEAVADGLDLVPPPARAARRGRAGRAPRAARRQRPSPSRDSVLGRADDVGEHDRRQHAVDAAAGGAPAGEELLDRRAARAGRSTRRRPRPRTRRSARPGSAPRPRARTRPARADRR